MLSKQECINRILANADTIMNDYGVRSLRLFGSVARNEQHESSDVDADVVFEVINKELNPLKEAMAFFRQDIILFLKLQAPDLDFDNGLRQRLNTKLYRFSPILFINLHYYCRRIQRYVLRLAQ